MKKMIMRTALISMLALIAAPTYAGEAMQMWKCEIDDDVSEQAVTEMAGKWLAAAKTMKGGENLKAYVNFPVAVNDTGESDAVFIVIAPSFEEWGRFWDGYGDSAAEKVDNENSDVVCPDSAVWESIKIK